MGFGGNVLAILSAAAAAWVFSAIYYTVLGRPWLVAMGKTAEQCKAEQASRSAVANAVPFILGFLGVLIMAWVTYGILVHLKTFTVRAGVFTALFCWLGFVLTTTTVNNAFAGRKPMLTVIDAGGWLGALIIIGTIIGWMGR